MNKMEFERRAKDLGIDGIYFCEPKVYTLKGAVGRVEADPFKLMPEVSCVVALVKRYDPFAREDYEQPIPTASYIASHSAHNAAETLAAELRESGARAKNAPSLPVKSVLAEAGVAEIGLNSLAAIEGMGTRIVGQMILTDAFEPDEKYDCGLKCPKCGLCRQFCPVGAIGEEGLNPKKCMRYHMNGAPMPEYVKQNVNSIFGCELCQTMCPSNARLREIDPPEEIQRLFAFESIFDPEQKGAKAMAELVGKNMLTKGRVRAQAICIAANLENYTFEGVARDMLDNGTPCESDAAQWYLNEME